MSEFNGQRALEEHEAAQPSHEGTEARCDFIYGNVELTR